MPNFVLGFIFKRFIKKYNEFFNIKAQNNANDWFILKLRNLVNNLYPSLYYALIYDDSEEPKKIYKELFGKEPKTTEDLNKIVSEIGRLSDKLKIYDVPKDKQPSIDFSDLIPMIEQSRGISIDRNMTLYEFKKIHDLEVKKWQQNQ